MSQLLSSRDTPKNPTPKTVGPTAHETGYLGIDVSFVVPKLSKVARYKENALDFFCRDILPRGLGASLVIGHVKGTITLVVGGREEKRTHVVAPKTDLATCVHSKTALTVPVPDTHGKFFEFPHFTLSRVVY